MEWAKGICLCNLLQSTQLNDREAVIEGRGLNEEEIKISRIFQEFLQYNCKSLGTGVTKNQGQTQPLAKLTKNVISILSSHLVGNLDSNL